jgi:hypothetical protein
MMSKDGWVQCCDYVCECFDSRVDVQEWDTGECAVTSGENDLRFGVFMKIKAEACQSCFILVHGLLNLRIVQADC